MIENKWFELAKIAVHFLGFLALKSAETHCEEKKIVAQRVGVLKMTLDDKEPTT